jgi:hypothetical protein
LSKFLAAATIDPFVDNNKYAAGERMKENVERSIESQTHIQDKNETARLILS